MDTTGTIEEIAKMARSGSKKSLRKTSKKSLDPIADELHDINFNWKDVGSSTKSELSQIWITGCRFLMDLPTHISSLSEYIQNLFSNLLYLLYGNLFERMFTDLQLVKEYKLDIHWASLSKFNVTVRQYCLTKLGLIDKSPRSLIEFVEIIRAEKQQIDFEKLSDIVDEITLNKTNELWDSMLLIRKKKVHIDGKLMLFYRAINPWTFTKMLSVIDTQSINVMTMLKNIEHTGVHALEQ